MHLVCDVIAIPREIFRRKILTQMCDATNCYQVVVD